MAVLSAAFVINMDAQVRDVDITVRLNHDGSAHITELWDLNADRGTEWYLVRYNLGDIQISGLRVEENGREFITEGSWNTERSMEAKAGRCGLARVSQGYEICWGLGSYGDHRFTVEYDMSNVVKSLNDYDMVHMQFVSPGISPSPKHVKVTILADGISFDDVNSRLWGFGYNGTANYVSGKMVLESSEPFVRQSSVIALVRLNKGQFYSLSIQSKDFDDVLDRAMEGSEWEDDGEMTTKDKIGLAAFIAMMIGTFTFFVRNVRKRTYRSILGVESIKEVEWARDVPYNGDVVASEYILQKLWFTDEKNRIAAAIILRMLEQGHLVVSHDAAGKVEISFAQGKTPLDPESPEGELYQMMKEASGSDQILQDREFSKWSRRNTKRIYKWTESLQAAGKQRLVANGWYRDGEYSYESQKYACQLVGLKKFLKEFTLSDERGVGEVALWQDYLIFAALFGVADKVAKELKDINPKAFDENMMYDYYTMNQIIHATNGLSSSITNARQSYASRQGAAGGHGGAASFGGGGGFSGGGFGGGAR